MQWGWMWRAGLWEPCGALRPPWGCPEALCHHSPCSESPASAAGLGFQRLHIKSGAAFLRSGKRTGSAGTGRAAAPQMLAGDPESCHSTGALIDAAGAMPWDAQQGPKACLLEGHGGRWGGFAAAGGMVFAARGALCFWGTEVLHPPVWYC